MERKHYQYAVDGEEIEGQVTSNDIWLHICNNTTAHGIPHITKANGSIKKTFWSILSLIFLVALGLNMYSIITRYASYPVNVLISLENDDELPFPTITICNMSPVRFSKWKAYFNTTNSTEVNSTQSTSSRIVGAPLITPDFTSLQLQDVTTPSSFDVTNSSSIARRRRKRDVDTITTWQMFCPAGWSEAQDRCLRKYTDAKSFLGARDACQSVNADLIVINDTLIQESTQVIAGGEAVWAGLYQKGQEWTNPGDASATPYNNWKSTEPDGSGPCVRAEKSWNYLWMDKECSRTDYYAACSLDMSGSCPAGWQDSGVRCHVGSPGTVVGHGSAAYCSSLHADATLAIVTSEAEQNFLINNIFDNKYSYWIGLDFKEAQATWPDGSNVTFANWGIGQPTAEEGCLEVAADGGWLLANCSQALSYICETDMVNITLIKEVEEEPEPLTCGCGATAFIYTPPLENETVVVETSMDTEPVKVNGSKFDRPAINEDFAGGENLIENLRALDEDVKNELGFQLEEMVLSCQFEGVDCAYSDFAHFHNPVHGNCYMFSSGWDNTSIKMSRKTGKRHGLHLAINIDQDDYHPDAGDTAGVRVVVHTPDRMPFPEDEGLTLGPGAATAVGLTQVKINRLGNLFGDCIYRDIPDPAVNAYELFHPVKYTIMACEKTCMQRLIVENCHCVDPSYPELDGVVDVPLCLVDNVTNGDCLFALRRAMATDISGRYKCDCPNACEQVFYQAAISNGQWPADNKKIDVLTKLAPQIPNLLADPSDPTKYRRNLMKLEMYYKEFNFETIYQVPAYPFANFLSDLGGVLGLFFGFSLLTLFEFIEFFADLFYYACAKYKKSKTRPGTPPELLPDYTEEKLHVDMGMFEPSKLSSNSRLISAFPPPLFADTGTDTYANVTRLPGSHLQGGVRVLPPLRLAGFPEKYARSEPPADNLSSDTLYQSPSESTTSNT